MGLKDFLLSPAVKIPSSGHSWLPLPPISGLSTSCSFCPRRLFPCCFLLAFQTPTWMWVSWGSHPSCLRTPAPEAPSAWSL